MTFDGKLTYIGQRQTGTSASGNTWAKVDIVVTETGTTYPNELLATAWNDKLDQFSGIHLGDDVMVEYDMRVREYNGKRYQDIKMWKIAKVARLETATPQQPATEQAVVQPAQKQGDLFKAAPAPAPKAVKKDFDKPDESDGLPF